MGHGCHDCGCPNGCECEPKSPAKPSEKRVPFTPYGAHGEVVKITAADAKYLSGAPKPLKIMVPSTIEEAAKPKSIEECDLEFLEELSKDKTSDGQRRYYVYDCEQDDWFFVGAAHCPYSLFSSNRPPKFADIGQELRYATKRTFVVYLRTKVRQFDRKLEEWF